MLLLTRRNRTLPSWPSWRNLIFLQFFFDTTAAHSFLPMVCAWLFPPKDFEMHGACTFSVFSHIYSRRKLVLPPPQPTPEETSNTSTRVMLCSVTSFRMCHLSSKTRSMKESTLPPSRPERARTTCEAYSKEVCAVRDENKKKRVRLCARVICFTSEYNTHMHADRRHECMFCSKLGFHYYCDGILGTV